MSSADWFISSDLPRSFYSLSEYAKNGNTYSHFEREASSSSDGYQSELVIGRIIYKDKSDNTKYTLSVLVKLFPQSLLRSTYTELTFINEIFVYTKILPFYATLNDSISDLCPKFFFGGLTLGDDEGGCVIMENLRKREYRAPTSMLFLDVQHLFLIMKKLGEFHAYSYHAKNTQPEKFYSLVDCLIETNFVVQKRFSNFLQEILEIYIELLSDDERYTHGAEKLKDMVKDSDELCQEIFTTRNEPMAVLCHGDFVRNNVLFKYDDRMNPIGMKFIDVANMRYCTPVVDIGLVLYMNSDQRTRDEYWEQLLDVYYESLENTFPNDAIPTKNQILAEFKRNILQPFLFAMFFIPQVLESEKVRGFWLDHWLSALGYDEYVGKSFDAIPTSVFISVTRAMHKGEISEIVLNIIKDILNKGFV